MVKKIVQFACDQCGTGYDTEDAANRCQTRHERLAKSLRVVKIGPVAPALRSGLMPEMVILEFDIGGGSLHKRKYVQTGSDIHDE